MHLLRLTVLGGLAVVCAVATPYSVHAACNLIPQAQPAFRSALGTVDRPFAAPGDFVDVRVRPSLCDTTSSGFTASAGDHVVTLLFSPPGQPRRAVVLTTDACSNFESRLDACQDVSGMANDGVTCVQVNQDAPIVDMGVVFVSSENRLRFRFPDTDAMLAPDGDKRGLTGPVTIAVSDLADALPCQLATGSCAAQAGTLGLLACVDDLYDADGTCQPNLDETFEQFTALPVANDFQADCYDSIPPCTATATELRFALDRAGNLLFPVHWQGVLPSTVDKPIPRLLRGTVRPVVPITVPDRIFLSSFTPEGQPLPPIFEPQADPTVVADGSITFFGSADAPTTVLRVARRRGVCSGGSFDGDTCNIDARCPGGGACVDACVGGANDGLACTAKKDCPDGVCGDLYDAEAFADLVESGGPLLVPRVAPPAPGICQAPPFDACSANADCGADPCVSYALRAEDPVALESLTAGSIDILTLTAPEALAITDKTGDFDTTDFVLTVRDRVTGQVNPLGAPDGFAPGGAPLPACGLVGTPEGRSLVRVPSGPYLATALATEHNVVAFLESEGGQGYCDENGDGDRRDGILRVFTVPGDERTAGVTPPRTADPALVINEQSLVVSGAKVFFRTSETGMATHLTERVSVATGLPGAEANDQSYYGELSKDGRWVSFVSLASNLLGPGVDTNGETDSFVRDRVTGAVTRVSVSTAGAQTVTGGSNWFASISENGRYVAFDSYSPDLVPGDTNVCFGASPCSDVFLRDRDTDADGVFDEPGFVSTTRISVGPGGVEANDHCERPVISADGKVVVFQSHADNLVADDNNGQLDIFAWDADTGTVERVNVASNEAENDLDQAGPKSYDVSDDGRYVVFDLRTTNLPDGGAFSHQGPIIDIFMRDRVDGTTAQVIPEVTYGGFVTEFAQEPRMSGDGRYVVFSSQPDFSGQADVWIKDRATDRLELVNVPVGTSFGPPSFSLTPSVSDDGRFVSFWSENDTLVPTDGNGTYDLFVRDRQLGTTERANVVTATGGLESGGSPSSQFSMLSADGSEVLFVAGTINLLGPAVDSNGVPDVFIHGLDGADPDGIDDLLFADGSLDDDVLEVLDAESGTLTTLCPAEDVAVAGGVAAFLRPESALGTLACPGSSLNGDIDVDDLVVQLWPGSGPVENLGKAATAIALTPTHVAAIVSEAGQPGGSLNNDIDTDDGVVAVRAVSGGAWTNVGQAAADLVACGSVFALLTPEAAQNGDFLNGDGDAFDDVVQIYVPETDTLINVGQAVEEIVCNHQILAFRTSELAQGDTDLIVGSGPAPPEKRDVMQAYNLERSECLAGGAPADCFHNSHQTVRACDIEACDPRFPYKVSGTKVKFITEECDQRGSVFGSCEGGGSDLTGDLDAVDVVLQLFDVHDGETQTLGEIPDDAADSPFQGDSGEDGTTVLVSTGRCLEGLDVACDEFTPCAGGAVCVLGECRRDHRTCVTPADCPPNVPCQTTGAPGIVAASPDTDGDGVPDHVDRCDYAPDSDQTDTDDDGIGDACDLATCGDGVRTYDEVCETGDDSQCPGSCANCRCGVCANVVVDPKAKVQLNTKNEGGRLSASVTFELGSYTDEPVTVSLADGDTPLIARESLGAIPASGKAPFKKWARKNKLKSGIGQVQLQKRPPTQPGMFKLGVKARRWFATAAANEPAASTDMTVTIGTQCFRFPVTKKTD